MRHRDDHPWTDVGLRDTTMPAAMGSEPNPAGPGAAAGEGAVLGDYRLIRELAAGGMGTVFAAEHIQRGHRVAIKLLHERLIADATTVARFFAEATVSARISHPGVVAVFEHGRCDGGAYLVMEYLDGESLAARLDRERRLPLALILDIGRQLGLALDATHAADVIHRDLKPGNVHLVPTQAGRELVKVLDFGVAKLVAAVAPRLTQRGDVLGTPFYMAPEQCVDPAEVDHRSDIYALGCMIYQLCSGRPPFRGSLLELMVAHRQAVPTPLRAIDASIPPALEALVACMMGKTRAERPRSMLDVAAALAEIQDDLERGRIRRRSWARWRSGSGARARRRCPRSRPRGRPAPRRPGAAPDAGTP
jgi:serine/threonine protein kinase